MKESHKWLIRLLLLLLFLFFLIHPFIVQFGKEERIKWTKH